MKLKDIEKFEKIHAQIEGLHNELVALAKKSPNDAVNKFKLGIINKLLSEANNLLGEKYMPFTDFTIFNIDELPTNSDVTLILSQYFNCLEKLRLENIKESFDYNARRAEYYWKVDGKGDKVQTDPPKKLR